MVQGHIFLKRGGGGGGGGTGTFLFNFFKVYHFYIALSFAKLQDTLCYAR